MARADYRFSYHKRVRISEIDAGGVVFNARYLDYLDIAIAEYFRAIRLGAGAGLGAPHLVARTQITYRAPITVDEMIDLRIRCARIGTTSLGLVFEYHGVGEADDLRSEGETAIVYSGPNGRPAPVPAALVAMIEAFEGRGLRA